MEINYYFIQLLKQTNKNKIPKKFGFDGIQTAKSRGLRAYKNKNL